MKITMTKEVKDHPVDPQMARERVLVLDQGWTCNGHAIRIPFAPEAPASGYEARDEVLASDWDGRLVYEVDFSLPDDFSLPVVRLHFGAVDQICEVYINDHLAGRHEGGYLSFVFDITPWLKEENHLRVEVKDTLSHAYPYGKQRIDRGGMWYTKVSGIWKTVWLENVAATYVTEWTLRPDLNGVDCTAVMNTGEIYRKRLDVEEPHLWTVEDPYLYAVRVEIGEDRFSSYFALRTVSIEEVRGVHRVCLNREPVFLHGVLDQGYWPQGIYTPEDHGCYEADILAMKELGFNLLRKHCKVEEAYFYFLCDKLGMLVCQDMVNSGRYHYWHDTILPTILFKKRNDRKYRVGRGMAVDPLSQWKDAYDDDFRREFFLLHCKLTQKELYNHPSVIVYTIFNEGWGQFDSDRAYRELKEADDSRLYDSASGWFAQKESDFDTEHVYFRTKRLRPGVRPMFLKECGGFSLPLAGHLWQENRVYGYGNCRSKEELTQRIQKLYQDMIFPAIPRGLCGCIYTQLSDIEDEINGLYTYDRQECKVCKDGIRQIGEEIRRLWDGKEQ